MVGNADNTPVPLCRCRSVTLQGLWWLETWDSDLILASDYDRSGLFHQRFLLGLKVVMGMKLESALELEKKETMLAMTMPLVVL